jgi:Zn ribbon nucleic-acid-binding protein
VEAPRRKVDERACRLCVVYRPNAEPLLPEPGLAPVCGRDRARLDRDLAALPDLHARLRNPDLSTGDERSMYRVALDRQGRRAWNTVPAGPTAGRTNQPLVSGSRPRREPADLTAVDLTAPAHGTNLTAQGRRHPDDHVGHLSVATILDGWVQVWRDELFPGQHRPPALVDELVGWLRDRVEEACSRLDVDVLADFADEIRRLRGALHAALGEVRAEPDIKFGVRCKQCDAMSTLAQEPGEDWVECGSCGLLYSQEEYRRWVEHNAGYQRSKHTSEQLRQLMGR